MKNSIVFILGLFLLSLGACIKEDHFGKSDRALIKTFVIPGQNGNSIIDEVAQTIQVTVPENVTDFNLTPSEITISNFASVSPKPGQTQDFSTDVSYQVTAEDGSKRTYIVTVKRGGAQLQLDNASFEDWYMENVGFTSVEQPGVDKNSTIWGTANRGLGIAGASGNTSKQMNGNENYARMESVAAPALVRIAAGTIFTGKFTEGFPNVSDPRSNITLGTTFSGRPLNFQFDYTYQPGASNEDNTGQALPYGDQCDVYLLLENRDGNQVKRVGTAWFRSGDAVTTWTTKTIAVKYGPLNATDPWYDYAQPQSGEIWGDGTETITHLTVLASSSFEGDFFYGAIGSTLEFDNVVLGY